MCPCVFNWSYHEICSVSWNLVELFAEAKSGGNIIDSIDKDNHPIDFTSIAISSIHVRVNRIVGYKRKDTFLDRINRSTCKSAIHILSGLYTGKWINMYQLWWMKGYFWKQGTYLQTNTRIIIYPHWISTRVLCSSWFESQTFFNWIWCTIWSNSD